MLPENTIPLVEKKNPVTNFYFPLPDKFFVLPENKIPLAEKKNPVTNFYFPLPDFYFLFLK
ncbi:hypothetical protein GCM10011379_21610 [Filimonas zeae]|uniref:Uncharacterized protein n=1 Tax=Filimonas zeae TaxID=1737353 RepID=A0A917IWT6_9BACT|nr:hypothetical protein GCM10011379_21610 [Filimonas zeae]